MMGNPLAIADAVNSLCLFSLGWSLLFSQPQWVWPVSLWASPGCCSGVALKPVSKDPVRASSMVCASRPCLFSAFEISGPLTFPSGLSVFCLSVTGLWCLHPPVPLRSYSWDDSSWTCFLKDPSPSPWGGGPYLSAGLALTLCLLSRCFSDPDTCLFNFLLLSLSLWVPQRVWYQVRESVVFQEYNFQTNLI